MKHTVTVPSLLLIAAGLLIHIKRQLRSLTDNG